MAKQVNLSVNDAPIELDFFVSEFIEHVLEGILAGLRGTGPIETLDFSIDDDKQVTINLNNAQVPISPFVHKIVGNTVIGMVSMLKGVDEISRLSIVIRNSH